MWMRKLYDKKTYFFRCWRYGAELLQDSLRGISFLGTSPNCISSYLPHAFQVKRWQVLSQTSKHHLKHLQILPEQRYPDIVPNTSKHAHLSFFNSSLDTISPPVNINFLAFLPGFMILAGASSPGSSMIWVMFWVESKFQVKNSQILHLEAKK